MTRYLARRLVHAATVLAGLVVVVFFVTRVIGDPARLMLSVSGTEEDYLILREGLGLNEPLWAQFTTFLWSAVRGDFGVSLWQGVPATGLVFHWLPPTLLLAVTTICFSMAIALPLGAIAGMRPGSAANRVTSMLAILSLSIPTFWLALMLIAVMAVAFSILPTSGYGSPQHLVLPVLALSAVTIGRIAEMVRTSVQEQMSSQYVLSARMKGLSDTQIVFKHVLRNASIPVLTIAGDEFANLVGGAAVIELIFGWPGVGQLAVRAIEQRDFPVIQASVLIIGGLVVVINLVVDLLYSLVDPRIRYG